MKGTVGTPRGANDNKCHVFWILFSVDGARETEVGGEIGADERVEDGAVGFMDFGIAHFNKPEAESQPTAPLPIPMSHNEKSSKEM